MINYRRINKLEKVKKFFLLGNELLVFDGDSIYLSGKPVVRGLQKLFGEVFLHNNKYLIIQNYFGSFEIFDLEGKLLSKVTGHYNSSGKDMKEIFFFDPSTNMLKGYTSQKGVSSYLLTENGLLLNNNTSINTTDNKLVCRDFGNKLLWELNLKELGKFEDVLSIEKPYDFEKFIGEWDSKLFIGLSGGLLIALNSRTGEIMHQWKKINPGTTILLAAEHKSIGIGGVCYWEINLMTNELKIISLAEELAKHNVRGLTALNDKGVSDSYFFCSVDMNVQDELDHHIGAVVAINRKTLTIDWKYVFDERQGEWATLSEGPRVADKKLYQMDSKGTLHMFEMEN